MTFHLHADLEFNYDCSSASITPRRSRKLRTQSHESLLEQLDEGYWAADFNAAGAELARLPPQFDQATVEAALSDRISCLEVCVGAWRSFAFKCCLNAAY